MTEVEVPKTQKAVVFEEVNGPLLYKDIPVPTPASDEILVKVQYSGVCHSDLSIWKGDWAQQLRFSPKMPLVGGHEGAGEVVGMGDQVTGWQIGDRTGVKFISGSCLTCEHCSAGWDQHCSAPGVSGLLKDGSFQQYACVKAATAPRIPESCDMAGVAPVLCAGITAYTALKHSGLKAGEWVVITGAGGGLGSYAVQYAKCMGFRVIAIDTGDDKDKHTKELGAEVFIDFVKSGPGMIAEIHKLTGGGAHAVVNFAVQDAAVEAATLYVRTRGTVVLCALPPNGTVKSHILNHVGRGLTIKGSYVGNKLDTQEAIDFYARGLVKTKYRLGELSKLEEYYQQMLDGKIVGRVVVDNSK
ncbi:Alcohol dehydrogenase 2 [Yarrowia sp. B02]|nr:Alcohol dehydrogenase 2 [Yarrowia sp. B02]